MKFKLRSVVTIVFMAASIFTVVESLNWNWRTGLVPGGCGAVAFVLSSLQLLDELKETKGKSKKNGIKDRIMDTGYRVGTTSRELGMGAMRYFAWLAGIYIGIGVIGLIPSYLLFIFLYLKMSRKVKLHMCIFMSLVTCAAMYIIIVYVAHEFLPESLVERLLF